MRLDNVFFFFLHKNKTIISIQPSFIFLYTILVIKVEDCAFGMKAHGRRSSKPREVSGSFIKINGWVTSGFIHDYFSRVQWSSFNLKTIQIRAADSMQHGRKNFISTAYKAEICEYPGVPILRVTDEVGHSSNVGRRKRLFEYQKKKKKMLLYWIIKTHFYCYSK